MEADGKIEQYCILAKGARGLALQDLIQRATAEPGVFAFSELLSVPAVQEVRVRARGSSKRWLLCSGQAMLRAVASVTDDLLHALQLSGPARDLLELFSYGTLADYKGTKCASFCRVLQLPCHLVRAMRVQCVMHPMEKPGMTLRVLCSAADPSRFPALSEAQQLKLKQLTVASIAALKKVCCPCTLPAMYVAADRAAVSVLTNACAADHPLR